MRLNKVVIFVIIVVFVGGGIGLSVAMNSWDNAPGVDIQGNPEGYMPVTSTGSDNSTADIPVTVPESQFKPAEIRGTNTFAEISNMFYIPIDDLAEAFGLTGIPDFPLLTARELKAIYTNLPQNVKLETESVRIFVSMYVNKPYNYSDTAYLPIPAVQLLKKKIDLSIEQTAFLESHAFDISPWISGLTALPTATNTRTVTGETSFQTVINWGVPMNDIEYIIGNKLTDPNILIRDYAMQNSMDFLTIVDALQKKVDVIYH